MKITRSLLAALFIVMTAAACSSSPTAPTPNGTTNNYIPLLGSGIGG